MTSDLGNGGALWLSYIVKEESKERGMIVPTWWNKEERLRNMRTWGHLDS